MAGSLLSRASSIDIKKVKYTGENPSWWQWEDPGNHPPHHSTQARCWSACGSAALPPTGSRGLTLPESEMALFPPPTTTRKFRKLLSHSTSESGKRSDKNLVIGQGQGWPADPGRTDICQFPLCRHKPYPNPQGILANAKIQRTEDAIARTSGSTRRMNESPHPHRPAHITTLIYCKHVQQPPVFSDMDHFPFSQQCSCPSATWSPPLCQIFPVPSGKVEHRHRVTCNFTWYCSGNINIRWVVKGSHTRMWGFK